MENKVRYGLSSDINYGIQFISIEVDYRLVL